MKSVKKVSRWINCNCSESYSSKISPWQTIYSAFGSVSKKRLISSLVETTLRQGEKARRGRESIDEEKEGVERRGEDAFLPRDVVSREMIRCFFEPPTDGSSHHPRLILPEAGEKGGFFFFRKKAARANELSTVFSPFFFFFFSLLFSQTLLLRLYALRVHDALLVIPVGPSLRNFISAPLCIDSVTRERWWTIVIKFLRDRLEEDRLQVFSAPF